MDFNDILQTALTFFFIANPIGNSPAIIAVIKDFPFNRQKKIMIRESVLALILALFFQFFGKIFLDLLNLQNYTVTLCGGILLFLVAIDMIFPPNPVQAKKGVSREPFLVPIATPLLAGPALLTVIMLYTQQQAPLVISLGILIAWVGVTLVLILAPYLQKILGKRGLIALEQLMGLVVSMIAMQMIVKGLGQFVNPT